MSSNAPAPAGLPWSPRGDGRGRCAGRSSSEAGLGRRVLSRCISPGSRSGCETALVASLKLPPPGIVARRGLMGSIPPHNACKPPMSLAAGGVSTPSSGLLASPVVSMKPRWPACCKWAKASRETSFATSAPLHSSSVASRTGSLQHLSKAPRIVTHTEAMVGLMHTTTPAPTHPRAPTCLLSRQTFTTLPSRKFRRGGLRGRAPAAARRARSSADRNNACCEAARNSLDLRNSFVGSVAINSRLIGSSLSMWPGSRRLDSNTRCWAEKPLRFTYRFRLSHMQPIT